MAGIDRKRPVLVVDGAGPDQAVAAVDAHGGPVRVERDPGDGAEEPDRVVLAAVALPVPGDQVVPGFAPVPAPAGALPGPCPGRDVGGGARVLPGECLPEERVGGDL